MAPEPILNGGKITTFSGFHTYGVGNSSTSNSGNTSGTTSNFGVLVGGHTAAAGVGGTLNNYGAQITVPNGSGASGTTNNYGLRLTGNSTAGTTNYALYSDSTTQSYFAGNVGVGTSIPGAPLEVGSSGHTKARIQAGGSAFSSALQLGGTNPTADARNWSITARGDGQFAIDRVSDDWSVNTPHMRIDNNGNVGFGSTAPATKLDVAGTVTARGLKLTTSPASGYVLTSDASGNGTWQNPGAGFANVSIGTTTTGSDLFFGSGANRTISVQSQATAGNSLTIQAGGTSGTNLSGGDLILSSGTANGTGASAIQFKTANGGAPTTSMTILGNGNVGIGTSNPSNLLQVGSSSATSTYGNQGIFATSGGFSQITTKSSSAGAGEIGMQSRRPVNRVSATRRLP